MLTDDEILMVLSGDKKSAEESVSKRLLDTPDPPPPPGVHQSPVGRFERETAIRRQASRAVGKAQYLARIAVLALDYRDSRTDD